ncbi:MAG: SUMF1/EgtB/PvdO family nonheme iron enzyme [Alphaproteobacteria bacterium]|nr:SUMF1/EgtB/PvdO family nonheme iron enzyme [Alphaproteobacteria bacterium]
MTLDAYPHDEPEVPETDHLGRDDHAQAMARLATECGTPLVVGLYGSWGVGKTTFMKQIGRHLGNDVRQVWFDPWRHQFDENPVLAFLQTMIRDFDLETNAKLKKLMATVGVALSASVLGKVAGLKFTEMKKIADAVADERFRIREEQVRLQQTIGQVIEQVSGAGGGRIVFFIDDLDRCQPEQAFSLLEALKLYLNLPNCVYFMAVDHTVVVKAVQERTEHDEDSTAQYLEKIVQLPFFIPPIHVENAERYVQDLTPEELADCRQPLIEVCGRNPRKIKQVVRTLTLYRTLAEIRGFEDYRSDVMALVLLTQLDCRAAYDAIVDTPILFRRLAANDEDGEQARESFLDGSPALAAAFSKLALPGGFDVADYVFLSRDTSGVAESEMPTPAGERVRSVGGERRGKGAPSSVDRAEQADFAVFRDADWAPEMVVIPAGTFTMGSPEDEADRNDAEGPRHEVTIAKRFGLGRYAVTFDEYDRFCEASGREKQGDEGWERGRRPAINVSWNDAQAYVEWLNGETGGGYRLPSESEWEYACRAGTETPFNTGTQITKDQANVGGDRTVAVGSFRPNDFGLHDMHGNVWEWVEDVWHDDYQGAPDDGTPWVEGGEPGYLRSAFRVRGGTELRLDFFGFRLARTLSR